MRKGGILPLPLKLPGSGGELVPWTFRAHTHARGDDMSSSGGGGGGNISSSDNNNTNSNSNTRTSKDAYILILMVTILKINTPVVVDSVNIVIPNNYVTVQ